MPAGILPASSERACVHLRRRLDTPFAEPVWPVGIRAIALSECQRLRDAHALMLDAYSRDGGGRVEAFDAWWSSVGSDAEYDPEVFFIVLDVADGVIAAAHCWRSAFVKDLVVQRDWRRRGLGRALLLHVFHAFRRRGAPAVSLKVQHGNPSGAERLYRRLGMMPVC